MTESTRTWALTGRCCGLGLVLRDGRVSGDAEMESSGSSDVDRLKGASIDGSSSMMGLEIWRGLSFLVVKRLKMDCFLSSGAGAVSTANMVLGVVCIDQGLLVVESTLVEIRAVSVSDLSASAVWKKQ